jgi:hypothetical protein
MYYVVDAAQNEGMPKGCIVHTPLWRLRTDYRYNSGAGPLFRVMRYASTAS